jgi:hypothetical protein
MSRQHEGIVVVAYKPGQPASQVQADLMLADIGDFTTSMVHMSEGHYGIGCKVNLIDEAQDILCDLMDEGFHGAILKGPIPSDGWRVV